jgi:hypothetical protein
MIEELTPLDLRLNESYRFRLHRNDLTTESAENTEGENGEMNTDRNGHASPIVFAGVGRVNY